MTDLTKLTVNQLRAEILTPENGVTFAEATNELARRAQANDLVQAERDEFDEELHTCRAIVRATSEHLHVDLEEMVDKLRRTEADAHSWQELATARAQANDALRSAARAVLAWLNGEALEQYPDLSAEATNEVEPLRCNLETALAAAPAPSSSGAPAPADPWTPVQCDYDRDIHANPDANAWADFFVQVHPGLADKHDLMRAWFANAMMAMHDSPRCKPAPADSQREAAIEAWRGVAMQDSMDADGNYVGFTPCAEGVGTPDELFALRREEIDEAVSLMRSAPPAPVAPVTDGVPPDLAAALAWWGDGTEPKTMAEAVEKARSYRNDAHELADVSFELRNQPEGNPADQVRRLLAPVTDAEVEAAIDSVAGAQYGTGFKDADAWPHGRDASKDVARFDGAKKELLATIARRVAEARGAGLRDLRARLVDFCRIRDRGYDVRSDFSPLWVLDEIDRLLAAPAASKLAEEPAQEADGPCLSALLANMRMEMSDGANGMRTPREEAIAAVVECVARRIEALERAAQGGGQ